MNCGKGWWTVVITYWTILIGRVVIEPRLDIPTMTGCYESVAHIFVGGLLGAAIALHWALKDRWELSCRGRSWIRTCWVLVIGLTAFETAMFVFQKYNQN